MLGSFRRTTERGAAAPGGHHCLPLLFAQRQDSDRCICVLIISACLQILFSDSQPASEPSDKFQAVARGKGGASIPVVRLASLDMCFDCHCCSLICENLLNVTYNFKFSHVFHSSIC